MSTIDRVVLLLGGKDATVKKAKALGLGVVLIQHPERMTAYQQALADCVLVDDYTQWPTALRLTEEAFRRWRPEAIVSLTEAGLEPAARLCELYEVPGTPLEVVTRLRDKQRMREHLAAFPSLALPFGAVTDEASLRAFGERAGHPFIVKPRNGAAGLGVMRVNGPEDTAEVWRRVRELDGSRSDRKSRMFTLDGFMMEALVPGPEFSVETFSFAGRHVVVAVTEKTVSDTHFAELGHAVPARVTEDVHARIRATMSAFLDAMGLTDGPTHTEVRLGPDGPVVIESHNRIGGGCINELVHSAYGVDLASHAIGWPLRLVPELPDRLTPIAAACTLFVHRAPGVVTEVGGVEALAERPEVLAAEISVRPGDRVRPLRDNWDRLGHLAVTAPDTDTALAHCAKLIEEELILRTRADEAVA
ncbi:ATP-grasp domain-containing protein [Streptomyces coerulescens]|uniref:ATP-grasp domain-containing protein n=1 Tax=Streptomyces coerulescens TaxID=29304 RepID=A0ABW0CKG8_STRCD